MSSRSENSFICKLASNFAGLLALSATDLNSDSHVRSEISSSCQYLSGCHSGSDWDGIPNLHLSTTAFFKFRCMPPLIQFHIGLIGIQPGGIANRGAATLDRNEAESSPSAQVCPSARRMEVLFASHTRSSSTSSRCPRFQASDQIRVVFSWYPPMLLPAANQINSNLKS